MPLCFLTHENMLMRLFFAFLLLIPGLLQPVGLAAQPSSGKGTTLYYEYLNLGMREKHEVTLSVQGFESLSVIQGGVPISDTEEAKGDFSIRGDDPVGRQVYKNAKTNEVVFRDFSSDAGALEPCVVQDPLSKMKWRFTGEKKQVGPYPCRSAQTAFRGREYVAWYTDELPITHGPWKFAGLPGAIVEVESADRIIQFSLVKVEGGVKTSVQRPTNGKVISMEEFAKRRQSAEEDFINTLKAKLPRGAEVTVNSAADHNLEIDFSDIIKK